MPNHLPAVIPSTEAPPAQFTREDQADFLDALSNWGNVRAAARATGVSRTTAYRMRRACPRFRALWDAALVAARPRVEEVLADRALNGVEEAVYYHGEEVAVRKRYDARLLLAHLGRLDRLASDRATDALAGEFFEQVEALVEEPEIVFQTAVSDQDDGCDRDAAISGQDTVPGVSGEPELRRVEPRAAQKRALG